MFTSPTSHDRPEPPRRRNKLQPQEWWLFAAPVLVLGLFLGLSVGREMWAKRVPLTLGADARGVYAVTYAPDGRTLATSGYDKTIRLWDVRTHAHLQTMVRHRAVSSGLAFSPHGESLASASWDGTVGVWDTRTAKCRLQLPGGGKRFKSVAFSPDGRVLAAGGSEAVVRLWDASTGTLLRTFPASQPVPASQSGAGEEPRTSLAFAPDNQTLAIGSHDGTIGLWNWQDGRLKRRLHSSPQGVIAVAFSPDGQVLASGDWDQSVHLWNPRDGRRSSTLFGPQGAVTCVAFSRDGRYLAAGSRDFQVRLWRRPGKAGQSWALERTLSGHQGEVWTMAFAPDGRTLVSASIDTTIKFWRLDSGTPVAP